MKRQVVFNNVPEIRSVQDVVLRSARIYGHKLALEDLKETPIPRLTYMELLNQVMKFGMALRDLGLPERSHIAVLSENRVQWSLSYLTLMCFNYVVVPVDRALGINDILNILHESDAVAVIYSDAFQPILEERRMSMKKLKYYINMDRPSSTDDTYSMTELLEQSKGCRPDDLPRINPEEMAEVIFTSGSLGRAKGVMLSQRNLAADLVGMVRMCMIYPQDRFLSVLPLHHTYECTCGMLCPLYTGASAHYAKSLKTVVDDLQTSRATMLLSVPLMYDKMFKRIYKSIQEKRLTSMVIGPLIKGTNIMERIGWKSCKKQVFKEIHERFGGHIRLFIAGGAAVDPVTARALREFGFGFLQGYGLTETAPILALNHPEKFKDDAAGLPLPGVTLKIHAPNNEGVGEVWAKGANVMLGYYKNEKATVDAFEGEWFRTGDLGFRDDDGFLHISGRMKNVIISRRGENVYPEEIEDLLHRSPYVLESMVYGEPDEKHDEIIAAQIVPDAEAFIELAETRGIQITDELMKEVIAAEVGKVNKELPGYKQIRMFHLRDNEFEKTTTQKVKRYLVKKVPGG
jgi:long-chain acyl-CoA synthetase